MTEVALLRSISWVSVLDAMKTEPAPEMEYEDAFKCVVKLAGRWGLGDYGRVEKVEADESFGSIHGILDLILENPREIVDWKTAGTLDGRWRERVRNSWQHRWYSVVTGARLFQYRGIMRNGRMTQESIELLRDTGYKVSLQRGTVLAMIGACHRASPNEAWPKTRPGACGAFGQPCRYLNTCEHGEEPYTPNGVDLLPSSLSVSSMDLFLLCPERYRREKIDKAAGEIQEHTEATLFGTLVHSGIAEVYRQIIKLQEKENK